MTGYTCPICGVKVKREFALIAVPYANASQHRCKESTLRAIDMVLSQEERNERRRTEAERLNEGLRIIGRT
jgi:C4-type Zn-finger protein